MANVTVYTDFDGVFNYCASRNKYRKNKNAFGHVSRRHFYATRGGHDVNWSQELVRKMNTLKSAHGFTWLWFSTWLSDTNLFPSTLFTRSDGYVDWHADSGLTNSMTTADVVDIRADRKYAKLKALVAADPHPFIWVDDEATVKYDAKDFPDVPHLVVTPDPDYGITMKDLERMVEFLNSL